MERRSGIGVDCSITRSSADYRRHMQMTRCCTIRNAHNETCSISQKVVATATTVHHWLGRGQWPLAASGADTIRCANQAGCPIALHLHLEEKPKEFFARGPLQRTFHSGRSGHRYMYVYVFCTWATSLCSLNQILLIMIVNCFINRRTRIAHSGTRFGEKNEKLTSSFKLLVAFKFYAYDM